jgi:hypothetical protein
MSTNEALAEGEELGSNILHVDGRKTAHLSAWRRQSAAKRAGPNADMPIVPRLTHRRRADRRRKPCDALNSRRAGLAEEPLGGNLRRFDRRITDPLTFDERRHRQVARAYWTYT